MDTIVVLFLLTLTLLSKEISSVNLIQKRLHRIPLIKLISHPSSFAQLSVADIFGINLVLLSIKLFFTLISV